MNKWIILIIPVVVGIGSSIFIITNSNSLPDVQDSKITATSLTSNGSPIFGNPSAPITILEWGDYQCTFCYRFHQYSLDTIHDEYIKTGKVKLVFKDFPLNGPDSIKAAEAAYCANDQGKYWEYHNELYKNWGGERTGWITDESLKTFATTVGLELNDFNTCLQAKKYESKVLGLEKFGRDIGVDATPSFYVFNDQKVIKIVGNQPLEVFNKAISEFD